MRTLLVVACALALLAYAVPAFPAMPLIDAAADRGPPDELMQATAAGIPADFNQTQLGQITKAPIARGATITPNLTQTTRQSGQPNLECGALAQAYVDDQQMVVTAQNRTSVDDQQMVATPTTTTATPNTLISVALSRNDRTTTMADQTTATVEHPLKLAQTLVAPMSTIRGSPVADIVDHPDYDAQWILQDAIAQKTTGRLTVSWRPKRQPCG